MVIEGFGVSLERLREEDIELVRNKRNSHTVSQFMEFRDHITPDMQKSWFESVNNINNMYYVITYRHRKIGLINGARIDWNKMETASGGIFIWEEDLWETTVPILANLLMMDLAVFLGQKRSFIKIMNSNRRAISYNTQLGYKPWRDENAESKIYVLESADYLSKTKSVRNLLYKSHGAVFNLVIDDPQSPVTQFLLDRVRQMPDEYRSRLNLIYR
jgi:RimJ/RimL family protein N-acetyltransferase